MSVGRAQGDTVGKVDADSSALAPPHSPPWTRTWLRQLRQGRLHLGARGCLAVPAPSSLLPYLPHALLDDVSHRGSSHMHALLHTLQPADLATKGVHLLRTALNNAWTAVQSVALCCISYKMAMVQQSTRDRVGPGPRWALAQRLANAHMCAGGMCTATCECAHVCWWDVHMCAGGMCICVLVGSVGGVRLWQQYLQGATHGFGVLDQVVLRALVSPQENVPHQAHYVQLAGAVGVLHITRHDTTRHGTSENSMSRPRALAQSACHAMHTKLPKQRLQNPTVLAHNMHAT